MSINLNQLIITLHKAWCAETSSWGDDWPSVNPARGQCIPSSLVVQNYLGGELIRFAVVGENINEIHYCNILSDGTLIDTTRMQYNTPVTLKENPVKLGTFLTLRDKLLADEDIQRQYETLKASVAALLMSERTQTPTGHHHTK